MMSRINKPTAPPLIQCPRLMWSPGLIRGMKWKAVPEAEGHRSIDDWKTSDLDERMQHTVEGVKRYCSTLPDDSKASKECWGAYDYLENELESAEENCILGGEGSCEGFEHWRDFLRQVESSGGPANTIRTLKAIANAHTHENDIKPLNETPEEAERISRRKAFVDFFIKMDTDSDGRLNAEEFRASMKKLGDELHGPTAALIFESLDVHGFLDLDQFLAVVEAEEIRSHSELAGIMRVSAQHLREKEHKWWSSMD